MEAATAAKSAVENAQREQRARREGQTHSPRFFELRGERWEPKFRCAALSLCTLFLLTRGSLPDDPQEATQAVRDWIYASSPAASG